MSPRRALRLALGQTAETDLGFPVMVSSIERLRTDHGSLMALVDPSGLMICIEAPDGSRGAVLLDLQLITALVECQTIGMVLSRPASARKTTRTDAAVSMPLIDGTLTRFETALQQAGGFDWTSGFRFSQWIGEKRGLGVALNAVTYDLFNMVLDIGEDGRVGDVVIALPVVAKHDAPKPAPKAPKGESLRDRVMRAQTNLTAVLCHKHMPLQQITSLKPGDVLTIPASALSDVSLVAGTDRTRVVANGALGQLSGQRAFRMRVPHKTAVSAGGPGLAAGAVDMADAGLVSDPVKAPNPMASAGTPVVAPPADTAVLAKQTPQVAMDTEALLSELGVELEDKTAQDPAPLSSVSSA